MADKCAVAKKVMRLKLQLTDGAESDTVLKTLHKLKEMDITVDILSETGIGKTVNSFRRHKQVGEFAKLLVKSWKSLIPKNSRSQAEDRNLMKSLSAKEKQNEKDCPRSGTILPDDLNNNLMKSHNTLEHEHIQALDSTASSEKDCTESRRGSHNDRHEKRPTENNKVSQQVLKIGAHEDKYEDSRLISTDKNSKSKRKLEDCDLLFRSSEENGENSTTDYKGKTKCSSDRGTLGSAKGPPMKLKTSKPSKGSAESLSFDSSRRYSKTLKLVNDTDDSSAGRPRCSEAQNKKRKKRSGGKKQSVLEISQESDCMESSKLKKKRARTKHEGKQIDCDSEEPSMSFESYLNYDENVSKRRERSAEKKHKRATRAIKKEPYVKNPKPSSISCAASDKQDSVMNLMNIPLPADLLQCERPSNVEANNFEKKVEREPGFCDVAEHPAVFPGQRLNKKMQVYSGAKSSSLPTMMSLHQQCIRTLQNNINLLYETGGVPFEILEPVLERCTPEQLLRIEEYNPIYVGVTDHLWGKHCKKEFKDSKLLEYESWKEMYIRLSEEREMKLQRLTKSIVSAHSSKPKGRQVKMAFIHTVAKPPRDVRIQQEIHGTAVQQPQQGRSSAKAPNNRMRTPCPEPSRSNATSPASGNTQELRKKSRVAPMMAKSLKAFKKQMGRR